MHYSKTYYYLFSSTIMLYLVTRSMILYLVTQSMLLYLPCFIEYVNDRFLQYIGSLLLNYAAVSVSVLIKSGIGQ